MGSVTRHIEKGAYGDNKLKFDPPNRMWLYTTMRSIFDCKYYEHKLRINSDISGLEGISRFCEFVFSWMGNFYYDDIKFKV